MITPEKAWARVGKLPSFSKYHLTDFRTIVYGQTFQLAGASVGQATRQDFPKDTIVLSIAGSAAPTSAAAADGFRYRNAFAVSFAYTGGESLTPGGPIIADALFGSGEASHYPAREFVIEAAQGLLCTVQNLCSTALTIFIAYHSLVRR